jgi:5-methylcytosine-specific restriction enzyme A
VRNVVYRLSRLRFDEAAGLRRSLHRPSLASRGTGDAEHHSNPDAKEPKADRTDRLPPAHGHREPLASQVRLWVRAEHPPRHRPPVQRRLQRWPLKDTPSRALAWFSTAVPQRVVRMPKEQLDIHTSPMRKTTRQPSPPNYKPFREIPAEEWNKSPPPAVAKFLAKQDQEWQRVYRVRRQFRESAIWKSTRRRVLTERPLCQMCGSPSREVDHIVAIDDGGSPIDEMNLQALCSSCHSKKSWEDERHRQRRRLSEYASESLGNGISQRYRKAPSRKVIEEIKRLRVAMRSRSRSRS